MMVSSEFSVFSRYFFLFFLEKSSKFHKDSLIPGMDRNFDFIRNSCQQGCWRKSGFPCWLWRSSERVHVVHHEKVTAPKTNMTMEEQPFWRCISYWTWWFFHCHVNFWGCTNTLFISNSFDCLRHWFLWLEHFAQSLCSENKAIDMYDMFWHGSLCQPSPIVAINKSLKTASTSSISAHPDCELMSRQPIWNRFGPNFRETCRGLRCIFDSSGGFHISSTKPSPPTKIQSVQRSPALASSKRQKGWVSWEFDSLGPEDVQSMWNHSRKARWIRFGGKLQQTNKNDVRKDLFVSSPTSTWTKKYHSFGGNDSQPAICKCEKKLQLLDVVLRCSQREDVFGWLLHLGSWWNLVR